MFRRKSEIDFPAPQGRHEQRSDPEVPTRCRCEGGLSPRHEFPEDYSRLLSSYDEEIAQLSARKRGTLSDIRDAQGLQYVDIVLEGGGVHGIALLGYLYALECLGVRFRAIGGTSAGAVTTLLVACAAAPDQERIGRIMPIFENMPLREFWDASHPVRFTVSCALGCYKALRDAAAVPAIAGVPDWAVRRRAWASLVFFVASLVYGVVPSIRQLWRNQGLFRGQRFERWLSDALKTLGVHSTAQMLELSRRLPESTQVFSDNGDRVRYQSDDHSDPVIVVATDLTLGTKVHFPRHASLYIQDVASADPAWYARASMSIPFFFEPIRRVFQSGDAARQAHRNATGQETIEGFDSLATRRSVLVDGGIMSNFPIDIFHMHGRVPRCPTFGAKLTEPGPPTEVHGLLAQAIRIFDVARGARDEYFISSNPDFTKLVTTIDTKNVNWLDFELTADARRDLFFSGFEAAIRFVRDFDWQAYKELRRTLLSTPHSASG